MVAICFPTCIDCVNPQAMNSTCNTCQSGYWDQHCVRACDLRCDTARGCDKVSGNCIACPPGKAGGLCDLDCPSTCLNATCTLSTTSNKTVCSLGCKPGFWGEDCSNRCNYCIDDSCDRATGACVCRREFYGPTCASRCPSGCALVANSTSPLCSLSNDTVLTCTHGCKPGFSGSDPECRVSCPTACADAPPGTPAAAAAVCNGTSTSNTTCLYGCRANFFSAPRCTSYCPYGCAESNSSNVSECHSQTGKCLLGCKSGYYGESCENRCPIGCSLGDCDTDGACLSCPARLGGKQCDLDCSGCVVDASRNLTCDEKGCSQCAPFRHGPRCSKQCPRCRDGLCDFDGTCTHGCVDGYYDESKNCELPCSYGCLADGNTVGPCSANGTCTLGCKEGRTNATCSSYCGSYCVGCSQSGCESCRMGHFGHLCDRRCGGCSNGCDRNGRCIGDCRDGAFGVSCQFSLQGCRVAVRDATEVDAACIECVQGYGAYCKPCPNNCSPPTSETIEKTPQTCDASGCLHGCVSGFEGPLCDMAATDVGALVAGILPPLLIVTITCLVICCIFGSSLRQKHVAAKAAEEEQGTEIKRLDDTSTSTPISTTVFVSHQEPVKQQPVFSSRTSV